MVGWVFKVIWDDSKKQFQVYVSFACLSDGWTGNILVKELPLVIAKESLCSCGSPLKLSDYRIQKTDDEIDLKEFIFCPQCRNEKQSLLQRIKQGSQEIWKDTTAVEVGPTGIKYQKKND